MSLKKIFFLCICLVSLLVAYSVWIQPFLQNMNFRNQVFEILSTAGNDTDHLKKYDFQPGEDSQQCAFPSLDPFDPRVMAYVKKRAPLDCRRGSPKLVDVIGNELVVNSSKVKAKVASKTIDACKYRNIKRNKGTDQGVRYGSWSKEFKTSIPLADDDHVLQVECIHKRKLISRSFLALVRKNNKTETKRQEDYKKHVLSKKPKETLSVLFVGLDGTSKQNFIRSFPKTRKFMFDKFKAIEYNKFNKVGLNTFPNVVPLLTGKAEEELEKDWNRKMFFDEFDHMFLWNVYQKAGYRTAAVFDNSWMTAFHYLKKGWANPTFDFNNRPLIVASERDSIFRKTSTHCMGDTPEATELLDYWLQLTSLYNDTSTPYFAYSFLSKITHDDINMASSVDDIYLRFFKEISRRNVLNNTFVIFFSDHGERFGEIRKTYYGVMAAKLPFLYFIFPPWFESKYPDLMKAFRINANRLMTTFDIHATLKELLTFTGKSQKYSPTDRSISLFSEIPDNRNCDTAGIPMRYCACAALSRKNTTSIELRVTMSELLLKKVMEKTGRYRSKCIALKLKKTLNVIEMKTEFALGIKTASIYLVTIETTPGNALYEATILHDTANDHYDVKDEITRLNLYRGQADCVDDQKIRPYCYCTKKT